MSKGKKILTAALALLAISSTGTLAYLHPEKAYQIKEMALDYAEDNPFVFTHLSKGANVIVGATATAALTLIGKIALAFFRNRRQLRRDNKKETFPDSLYNSSEEVISPGSRKPVVTQFTIASPPLENTLTVHDKLRLEEDQERIVARAHGKLARLCDDIRNSGIIGEYEKAVRYAEEAADDQTKAELDAIEKRELRDEADEEVKEFNRRLSARRPEFMDLISVIPSDERDRYADIKPLMTGAI